MMIKPESLNLEDSGFFVISAGFDPRLESSWDIYWHGLIQA
jgi:hypothetical protein